MPDLGRIFILLFVITAFGCSMVDRKASYEEIPPMLSTLTNKAQRAVEKGHSKQDEIYNYTFSKNPNILRWFEDNGYRLKFSAESGHAIVMVCDGGRALFEDTYCKSGRPDRDFTGTKTDCKLTLSKAEVAEICEIP